MKYFIPTFIAVFGLLFVFTAMPVFAEDERCNITPSAAGCKGGGGGSAGGTGGGGSGGGVGSGGGGNTGGIGSNLGQTCDSLGCYVPDRVVVTGVNPPPPPPPPPIWVDLPWAPQPTTQVGTGNIGGGPGVTPAPRFDHPDGEKECADAVASGAAAAGSTYAGSSACGAGGTGVSHTCTPTPSSSPSAAMVTACKFPEPPPPADDTVDRVVIQPTAPKPNPPTAPKPDENVVRPPQPAPDWNWNGNQWAPPTIGGGSGGVVIPITPIIIPPVTPITTTPTPVRTLRPDLTAGEVLHAGTVGVGVTVDLSALIVNIGTIPTDQ